MHEHHNKDIKISQEQPSSNNSSPSSSLVDNDHLESISLSNQFTNAAFHNSDESTSSPPSTLRSIQPSSKSNSTTTTTTTTTSSSISSKQSKRKQDQLRFQQIFSGTNSNSKTYKRCTCKKNQKQFDCHECTQPFPIQVRRSRDGESGILYNLQHNCYTQSQADAQSAANKTSNKSRMDPNLISSVEEESDEGSGSSNSSSSNCSLTTQNHQPAITLKPTPFKTVSPTLLSLLAMSNPNSRFVPPPNISLSTYSKHS